MYLLKDASGEAITVHDLLQGNEVENRNRIILSCYMIIIKKKNTIYTHRKENEKLKMNK